MVQPELAKSKSSLERIFTTAPRGRYAVDEKQMQMKDAAGPGLWSLHVVVMTFFVGFLMHLLELLNAWT